MRTLNSLIFSILTGLVFITSCEYQLDSENFGDISKPDTTQAIQIELSPNDTFYMFTVPVDIHYNLNTFGLTIYNVCNLMTDQPLTGPFLLMTILFSPGVAIH